MRTPLAIVLMMSLLLLGAAGPEPRTPAAAPPAAPAAHGPALTGEDGKPVAGVQLAKGDLRVSIHGALAQATMTLTFANALPQVLGGTLVFPLPQGATVTGYGLEINGQMVDGVAVEKERARVIYEQELHKRVDPGLVEHVEGNAFRTRLYPIPPNGSRSIKIEYVTQVEQINDGAGVALPMGFGNGLDELSLRIDAPEATDAPTVKAGVEGLVFNKVDHGFTATFTAKNAKVGDELVIALPRLAAKSVAVQKRLKYPRTLEEIEGPKAAAAVPQPADFENYFVLTDTPAAPPRQALQLKNKRVGIVWDASLSRADSDHARELKLLQAMLARLGDPMADLIILRNDIEVRPAPEGGPAATAKLIESIRAIKYDGATNLGGLILPRNVSDYPSVGARGLTADFDLFLLFTDGFGNLGADRPLKAEAPVNAFSDAVQANYPLLGSICQESGGSYFDLKRATDQQVLEGVGSAPFSLVSVDCKPGEVADVYPPVGTAITGRFTASGRLLVPNATVTLNYGYGKQVVASSTFTLDATGAAEGSLLPRFWAQQKAAALGLFPRKNADELARLGRQFNLVTADTSLLVLETVDQYVQYRVVPPPTRPEIYKQFLAMIEQHKAQQVQTREQKLQQVAALWTARVQWWDKTYKYPDNLKVATTDASGGGGGGAGGRTGGEAVLSDAAPTTAPLRDGHATLPRPGDQRGQGQRYYASRNPTPVSPTTPPPPGTTSDRLAERGEEVPQPLFATAQRQPGQRHLPRPNRLNTADEGGRGAADKAAAESDDLQVAIKPWDPKTPYVQAMKKGGPAEAYDIYLDQRKNYAKSPAFYFDCADYLVQNGQTQLGVRVLTDVVELQLQDARLLRVAAHRLNQIGQRELAIDLFEKILQLRPEEPQSYRDLALALADRADARMQIAPAGGVVRPVQENVDQSLSDYTRALELLNTVVLGNWPRFPEVELPVLMEANDIAAKALRLPGVHDFHNPLDARLVKNLDLDVRVVMTWDADQTDIDLWVTEPSGEKCFYGHNRTIIGGLLSRDFTDGYGPEEYCLRKLMPGKYIIQSNFYGSRQQELTGPATVQATVITDFGRPTEKRQSLTLRLKDARQIVDIGAITLGAGDPKAVPATTEPADLNK